MAELVVGTMLLTWKTGVRVPRGSQIFEILDNASEAHLVERLTVNQMVVGSIPTRSAKGSKVDPG